MTERAHRVWGRLVGLTWVGMVTCVLVWLVSGRGDRYLNPDQEVKPSDWQYPLPAIASGALLIVAAIFTWRSAAHYRGRSWLAVRGLSVGLAWMSVDELAGVHERLEHATGVDWMILYLPVMALLGVGALILITASWRRLRPAAVIFALGGASWAVAQVLEAAQWNGDMPRRGYVPMMVTEEILEALGSALFALSALRVLRSRARVVAADGATSSSEESKPMAGFSCV